MKKKVLSGLIVLIILLFSCQIALATTISAADKKKIDAEIATYKKNLATLQAQYNSYQSKVKPENSVLVGGDIVSTNPFIISTVYGYALIQDPQDALTNFNGNYSGIHKIMGIKKMVINSSNELVNVYGKVTPVDKSLLQKIDSIKKQIDNVNAQILALSNKRDGTVTINNYDGEKGATYTGQATNGKPSGNGTIIYKDGSKYTGGWSKGEYSGYGVETQVNGKNVISYNGNFKNGQYNGYGVYINHDYSQIIGNNDKYDIKYEGNFVNGKFSGKGKLTFFETMQSGFTKYEGSFSDDLMDGVGKLYLSNGDIIDADISNKTHNGKGKVIFPNGNYIEANFDSSWSESCEVITPFTYYIPSKNEHFVCKSFNKFLDQLNEDNYLTFIQDPHFNASNATGIYYLQDGSTKEGNFNLLVPSSYDGHSLMIPYDNLDKLIITYLKSNSSSKNTDSDNKNTEIGSDNWNQYEDNGFDFTMNYPSNWDEPKVIYDKTDDKGIRYTTEFISSTDIKMLFDMDMQKDNESNSDLLKRFGLDPIKSTEETIENADKAYRYEQKTSKGVIVKFIMIKKGEVGCFSIEIDSKNTKIEDDMNYQMIDKMLDSIELSDLIG